MLTASRLAGFFAAHAIWSVSDSDSLIPMLAYSLENGERQMERLMMGEHAGDSVAYGKDRLEKNEMDASDAALLYDGRISLDTGKRDAILVEIRCYFSPNSQMIIAVPYTPKSSGKFRVHRPKLLAWNNCDDFDRHAVLQAFFDGVDDHQQGAKVWNDALDESI